MPFVERWFDIAPDKASQLEALWHLAVLRRNQEEWVLVIKLCDRAAEEYFSEDNLTSNWKSVRDHAVEQLQNVIERKPEQHDSKDE